MKALLWLSDNIFGKEANFKFASTVLAVYAKAELDERDSSVELFILNHWVKEFTLRDLIDRVADACTQQDDKLFPFLMKWLNANKLSGDSQWQIEDLRKVALLLAKNLKTDVVGDFFVQAVEKIGKNKVRDFMEI